MKSTAFQGPRSAPQKSHCCSEAPPTPSLEGPQTLEEGKSTDKETPGPSPRWNDWDTGALASAPRLRPRSLGWDSPEGVTEDRSKWSPGMWGNARGRARKPRHLLVPRSGTPSLRH